MSDKLAKEKLSNYFKLLAYHKISDLTANHASILSSNKNIFLQINIFIYLRRLVLVNL